MKRKDIEKAAGDYSGSILGFRENNSVMAKHKAFVDGAEWRINIVWHDVAERPKLGELIIVEVYGKIWDYGKYDVCDTIHPKARWAYMKDLISNTED